MSRTRHHGDKAKRLAFGDDWQWLRQTPGWWVKLKMTVAQRRGVRDWEHNAARTRRADLDTLDLPPHGKKPHIYYW